MKTVLKKKASTTPTPKIKASNPIKHKVGEYKGNPTLTIWDSSKSAEPTFMNGVTIGIGKAILLANSHDALLQFINDHAE